MKITCVILSKNEEKNIGNAIKSAKFCDEVIVVDDFSTDKTVQTSKSNGATVYSRHLNADFSGQREYGVKEAKYDWILFLDADEIISQKLKDEITNLKKNEFSAYYIKRRDFFWGRELKYGETGKVRRNGIIRLLRKNQGKWVGKIHEEFKTTEKTGRLENYIDHYPHQSIKEFLDEINFYSNIRAKELLNQGKKSNFFELIFYPLGKFIYNYLLKLGFLDGPSGFTYAFMMSFHSFLVRTKLFQFK